MSWHDLFCLRGAEEHDGAEGFAYAPLKRNDSDEDHRPSDVSELIRPLPADRSGRVFHHGTLNHCGMVTMAKERLDEAKEPQARKKPFQEMEKKKTTWKCLEVVCNMKGLDIRHDVVRGHPATRPRGSIQRRLSDMGSATKPARTKHGHDSGRGWSRAL